ncbi:MAG: LytTR family DNA-binding domain-containing protein [Bacteroides sp.]|nr:LytTR family DNA-binding domain-containing protein [Bacteroides sp.]MCM1390571.1 LytTR family DNA-binding domain-containing protein [Bacteroides sp.]
MRDINCIAIDDEPLALDIIANFCGRIGGINLLTFSDPNQGLDAIKRLSPDIVFLDIEMENINGLSIAAQLPPETCFIFTTAYLKYALDGFELDAVDYLHKPFSFARFETAFSKAMRRKGMTASADKDPRSIVVKQEYNNVNIPLSEILYIEAMEGYSKIFRIDGTCIVSRIILKNIGTMLPVADFLRIHRSFIVSKSKVVSFNKQEIKLCTGKKLPVGRLYSSDVVEMLSATNSL